MARPCPRKEPPRLHTNSQIPNDLADYTSLAPSRSARTTDDHPRSAFPALSNDRSLQNASPAPPGYSSVLPLVSSKSESNCRHTLPNASPHSDWPAPLAPPSYQHATPPPAPPPT